jgi:hypothetical protein
MIVDKLRHAILANATVAVMTIALGTSTALEGNKVHLPKKCTFHSGARVRPMDCTFAPQAVQSPEDVHDPSGSMHQE